MPTTPVLPFPSRGSTCRLARRTPATVGLAPGPHRMALRLADLGSVAFDVRGARGDHAHVDGALWGSLAIAAGDAPVPVHVTIDGQERGAAPLTVGNVMPG